MTINVNLVKNSPHNVLNVLTPTEIPLTVNVSENSGKLDFLSANKVVLPVNITLETKFAKNVTVNVQNVKTQLKNA